MKKRLIATCMVMALVCAGMPARAVGVDDSNGFAAGGMTHSLAVQADGTVLVWGSNQFGQLGIEDAESKTPVELEDFMAVSVAAGSDFSAALRYDGTVYIWGYGEVKQPTQVPTLSSIVAIAAGQTDVLALKSDGTVWQWTVGGSVYQVQGLSRIASVSCGGGHFLALTTSGEVYSWGNNSQGQLGDGSTVHRSAPMQIKSLVDIVDIAAGSNHSLAVGYNGTVYAWGSNMFGQVGDRDVSATFESPIALGLSKVIRVAAGSEVSMALTESGKVYTWGYGEYGQIGNGKTPNITNTPVEVENLSGKIVFIAAGMYHNMAINENGTLYTWGRNKNYQLGNGKGGNGATPQSAATKIAASGVYNVERMGEVSSWARTEAEALYKTELVPPMLWGNYQNDITRAEFAHLLVSVYEQVKGSSVTVSAYRTEKYTDISDHMLASDMKKAFFLGIVSGTSDTTFSPDRTITRQEAAKMLCGFVAKMQKTTVPDKMENLGFYNDAGDIAVWAVPYVYYAYQNDIMKGTGTGGFAPQKLLSREQSLVIMSRLVVQYGWTVK